MTLSEAVWRHPFQDLRRNRLAFPVIGLAGFFAAGLILWFDAPLFLKLTVLLLALGIATVVPVAAIGASLAATPFIFDPVTLSGREFSLLELAIVVGGAGIAVNALGSVVSSRSLTDLKTPFHPWAMTFGIVGLLAAASVSLATLADERYRPESLREFRLVIVEPLLFFAACRWVLKDAPARRFASYVLVGTGAAIGLVAIGQLLITSDGVVADGVRRATGPYPHPNNLALFLERAGLLGAGYALSKPGGDRWLGLAAVLALAGTGATFSRGAVLAVIVGILVVFAALRRMRGIWVLGLAVAAVLLLLLATAGDRVLDTGSTGDTSTRWLIWEASVRMALDHPIWGVGLDQFYTQYWPRYVDPAGWPERYTSHAHNLFLDVWLRLGILGLIVFVGIGAFIARQGARILLVRNAADPLAVGAVAALVTGFVHGMVDNGFFLPDLAVLTWFAITLIEKPGREPIRATSPSE